MSDLAQTLIEQCEGCKLTAYKDSLGKWTVGYGHLLQQQDKDWTDYTITQDQADELLSKDMQSAIATAQEFPHYVELNEVRQAALISMAYQLGTKPLYWPHFMNALEARDYNAAAAAGLDSEWHAQTPARAEREMTMLRTGNWALSA